MNDLFNKYKQILSGGVSQTANKLSNFLSRGKVSMQGTNQTSGLLQNPQVQAFTSPILNELKRVVPSANKVTQFSAGPGMAYALMGKKDAIPKLSEIGDTVKLGLMAGGAYAAPAAIGLGTALGAGLKVGSNIQQRKPIAEDLGKTLGEGVVSSAPYAGLFGLTNPVTQKVASFAGSKFSSPIASRITSGLANLGEGAVNTSALGGKYGALDAALDFGSGLVGTNIRGVSAERSITDGRLSPETLDELTRAEELLTKKVKDFGFGTRLSSQAKLKVKQMQDDAIETIDRIAGEYLPDNVLEKVAGNPLKTLKAIVDQHSSTGTGIKKINPLSNLVEEPLKQSSVPTERTGDVLVEARNKIKSGVPSRTTNIKQTLKDLYTDWVNRFYPVEDLVSQVEKKGNFSIRPEVNPKYQIKRLMGSGAVAELRHMKELNPILSELGEVPSADFDVFLKAKRDIGFSSAGRAVYGSDPAEAQKIVTALSQKYDINQLESVANKLYEYQDKGLQMLIDNGFINAADAASMKAANPDYVPFQRVMGELDNYLGLPTNKLSQGTNPIQKIKGSDRDIYSPVESIIANTYKMEAAISKNNVAKSIAGLSKIDEGLGEMIKQVPSGGENTFPVWIDGKKQFYTAPEDILRVIKGLNEEGMGTITKILSAPARLLRQGATGSNIDFMIPNIFKDQFDAAINAKYGYTPFVDYMRGLAHLIKYERGGDALVEDWINSGGKIFFENMAGRKSISQQVSDSLDKKTALQRLGNFISGTFKTVGNYSENPTRIGLYKRALDATGNKLIAATESREGTLDFGRMGAKMKAANAVIPFLNVGVQGFDKLIRTVKNNPKQTAVRMGIYAVAPATMAAIYNNMFHPEEYASIPQYEKDDNFILITGKAEDGSAQYVTFPKGNVLPMIANPVENFITYLAGNNPQGFKSLALQLLGDTLPVVEGGDDFRQAASRTIGSNTPAAFKPLIESVANYNFFKGKPIVPGYLQSKAPSERVKESTPGIYKYLGGVVNQSPLQVQNFTEGTLAGFAKMPINIADTVMTAAAGEKVDVNKIPIVRRFIAQGDDPQTVAKYKEYEQRDKEKQAVMKGATPPILDRILNIKGTKASSVSEIKDPSVAKFKVEKTGEPVTSDGIYYYKNKETGKIDSVKLDREIKQPVVTGNEIVDKERQAKYKRDLTAKKNDILEQMEIGLLTPSQAEKKINQLQASQKITFPAIPKLTGNSLLDKENVDEFVGKLTEIKNSIVKQNAIGTISDKEAEAKLSQLTLVQKAIRAKVSTKKVKTVKLKIPKAKIRKIKVSVLKAPKQYKLKKVRLKTPVLKKTKLT